MKLKSSRHSSAFEMFRQRDYVIVLILLFFYADQRELRDSIVINVESKYLTQLIHKCFLVRQWSVTKLTTKYCASAAIFVLKLYVQKCKAVCCNVNFQILGVGYYSSINTNWRTPLSRLLSMKRLWNLDKEESVIRVSTVKSRRLPKKSEYVFFYFESFIHLFEYLYDWQYLISDNIAAK